MYCVLVVVVHTVFIHFTLLRHEILGPSHHTCEGLERVHLEGLLANGGQVHLYVWTDRVLLQPFADLVDLVGDALWGGS